MTNSNHSCCKGKAEEESGAGVVGEVDLTTSDEPEPSGAGVVGEVEPVKPGKEL